MLNSWHTPVSNSCWSEELLEPESDEGDFPVWSSRQEDSESEPAVGPHLEEEQRRQLQDLLLTYKSTLQSRPGRTDLAKHRIPMESSQLVRLPLTT